jgi:hypothetical protein
VRLHDRDFFIELTLVSDNIECSLAKAVWAVAKET